MESIREIFVPANNRLALAIPVYFIEKTMKVPAFEIAEKSFSTSPE
ncbi:MAG: hypothetical protein ABI472_00875 [Ginsengibacter sp.]